MRCVDCGFFLLGSQIVVCPDDALLGRGRRSPTIYACEPSLQLIVQSGEQFVHSHLGGCVGMQTQWHVCPLAAQATRMSASWARVSKRAMHRCASLVKQGHCVWTSVKSHVSANQETQRLASAQASAAALHASMGGHAMFIWKHCVSHSKLSWLRLP